MDKNEQLHALAIFHWIVGGMAALFSLFPLIHVGFGLAIIRGALNEGSDAAPPFVGWILIGVGALFIVAGWSYAILVIIAGRNLNAHRHYLYCLVIAAIETVFMPFGTILGVFTIVVLLQEPVKALFATQS